MDTLHCAQEDSHADCDAFQNLYVSQYRTLQLHHQPASLGPRSRGSMCPSLWTLNHDSPNSPHPHNLICFLFFKLTFVLFFKKIFWCGQFLKSLLNVLQYCFYIIFVFFDLEAYWILAPRPRTEPVPPALEAESLNHWTAGEVPMKY